MVVDEPKYSTVTEADQVTEEVLEILINIVDGWYPTGRIDWGDVWDRAEGAELADGTRLDLGNSLDTPAMNKIRQHVKRYRRLPR